MEIGPCCRVWKRDLHVHCDERRLQPKSYRRARSTIPRAPEACVPSALLTDSARFCPSTRASQNRCRVSGAPPHARSATAQAHDIAEQSCLRIAHSALSNSLGSTRSTLTIEGTEARSATAVIMAKPTGMSVE